MNSLASLKMNAIALGDTLVLQFSWQDHLRVSERAALCNMLKFTLCHDITCSTYTQEKLSWLGLRTFVFLSWKHSAKELRPFYKTTYYATSTVFNILFRHYK